jgi:hypothetical protein
MIVTVGYNFMRHTLQIENQTLDFSYKENANCWQTVAIIDNVEIEIEIDFAFHRQGNIDWQHFIDFFKFISVKNRLQELAHCGIPLISEVGKTFFRRSLHEIKDWKMMFKNSIFYNGKVDEHNQKDKFSFSILYDYFIKKDGRIDGDAYGLYIVDVENLQIVGARRHQC